MSHIRICLPLLALLTVATASATSPPPTPMLTDIGVARSQTASYQGTIRLDVDVSDLDRRLFTVRESLPVQAGPMKLWYPQWLPGNHAPRGPIEALAGLEISAQIDGLAQAIEWTRDPYDVHAFKLEVPEGATQLDLRFQFMSPVVKEQGRVVATPEIVGLQWNTVVLYPASASIAGIGVQANLRLPPDWDAATALAETSRSGDAIQYETVPLETLVDSPVFAGKHFRKVALGSFGKARVGLNIAADSPAALTATLPQLAAHAKLIAEAEALFGMRHFDRYEFLLAVSDQFSGIGLEHHRSSENGVSSEYFSEWDKKQIERSLLPHEFVHSWCGKYRRPQGQAVGNFNTPLDNELLWVYEGQTQYWGQVLAARSGLWSAAFARDSLAYLAATLDARAGRDWRTLQDTVHQPIITARRPLSNPSWQRSEDYYNEGLLLWFDADTRIREATGEAQGLDDFARLFFGPQPGQSEDSHAPKPFRFEDVTAALTRIAPDDWAATLRTLLDGHGPGAPLDGLARAGWKLAFTDRPTDYVKGVEERNKLTDHTFSLGLAIEKDADIADVVWNSPAFKAGLSKGDTLIAVNGMAYKPERLKAAIKAAQQDRKPVELLLRNLEHFRTVKIAYTEGLRYPTLQRIEGTKDRLSAILAARTAAE